MLKSNRSTTRRTTPPALPPAPVVAAPVGTWLAASAQLGRVVTTDEPYPCRCSFSGRQRCGGWRSCPCHAHPRPPGLLPDTCCAKWTYELWLKGLVARGGRAALVMLDPGLALDTPEMASVTSPSVPGVPQAPPGTPRGSVASGDTSSVPARGGSTPAGGRLGPYERRWTPDELTCACSTPFDGTRQGGQHCPDCHVNCVSSSVFVMLHPVLGQHLDPAAIRDVERGTALLAIRRVGTHLIWGWAPPVLRSAPRPVASYSK